MNQSTTFAQVATDLLNVLQGYTKGIRLAMVLTMLLIVGIGQAWAEDATLSFANKAQRTSFSTTKQVWEQNGVTFTNDKSSSTNDVADYANPVRLYANSKVTVAFTSNMTKIVFDCSTTAYATAMKNSIGNSATASSDKVTVTLDGTSNTFTVAKLTAQVRLDAITITYVTETSIYLNPGVWNADGAKYAIYYFNGNTTGWSSLMTKVNDCEEIYTTKIPQLSNMTIIPVRLSNDATSGDWNKKWNQTENITFNSNYDFIQITNWGSSSDNCPYTYNSKYTSKTFTITFKGNNNTGGTMSQVTGITCKGSKTLPANTFTRTGYNFNGWNTNANGTGTQYAAGATISNITSDITLYAQWKIGTYTITLNANGGSGHTTSVTATYNSATLSSAITNPTRTGYAFKGWYSSSSGGSMVIGIDGKLQANVSGYTGANGVWTATSAKTLYAQWQILSYTVTWVVDGGQSEETVNHGAKVADAPDIDPNNLPCGQKFAGWTDNPITGTTDDAPNPLYKTAAEIPAIEKATTFYAVFADYAD